MHLNEVHLRIKNETCEVCELRFTQDGLLRHIRNKMKGKSKDEPHKSFTRDQHENYLKRAQEKFRKN